MPKKDSRGHHAEVKEVASRSRSGLAALGAALERGRGELSRLDASLERLVTSDLTLHDIGRRLTAIQDEGRRRLNRLGTDAVKRLDKTPGAFISAAAAAARSPVQALSKELHGLAERLGSGAKSAPPPSTGEPARPGPMAANQ